MEYQHCLNKNIRFTIIKIQDEYLELIKYRNKIP